MLQRWRAVGNTVSDLTGPRFEPLTSRSRDERVTVHILHANITFVKKSLFVPFWLYICSYSIYNKSIDHRLSRVRIYSIMKLNGRQPGPNNKGVVI